MGLDPCLSSSGMLWSTRYLKQKSATLGAVSQKYTAFTIVSAELEGENLNHAKVFQSKHSQGWLLEQIKGYLELFIATVG